MIGLALRTRNLPLNNLRKIEKAVNISRIISTRVDASKSGDLDKVPVFRALVKTLLTDALLTYAFGQRSLCSHARYNSIFFTPREFEWNLNANRIVEAKLRFFWDRLSCLLWLSLIFEMILFHCSKSGLDLKEDHWKRWKEKEIVI